MDDDMKMLLNFFGLLFLTMFIIPIQEILIDLEVAGFIVYLYYNLVLIVMPLLVINFITDR